MLIDTPRLELRPFGPHDLADLAALLANPDFMAWSIDGPMNAAQARARLDRLIACYRTHGFAKWAVRTKVQPTLIGYCGLETETVEGRQIPELGFRLHPDNRGKGLATEAALAAVDDAFNRLGLPSIYAFVEPGNEPSRRVLGRLGMTFERELMLCNRNYLLYLLDRPRSSA